MACAITLSLDQDNDVIGENRHSGNSPAAYSDAELGKKNLCLGCVLVSGGGGFVYWFYIPMSDQAIKRLLFSAPGFSAHFLTPQPLTMSHKIASSSLSMVTASVI
jgi:hypothetical protein